jgi:hypothetical protein
MVLEYLKQPYPLFGNRWKIIISISLFIAVFMLVFQPFGLLYYHSSAKYLIIAGYGGVTCIILSFNLFVITRILKISFREKTWTVAKQILWLIWIVFTIGLGNYLYSFCLHFIYGGFHGMIIFQLYTLLIGFIPVIGLTVWQQNKLLARNLKLASELNGHLGELNKHNDDFKEKFICFTADNEKDRIKLLLTDLLYIESQGNYIQVYQLKDNKVANTLIRSSLKRAESVIDEFPVIIKCHRAFLVNTMNISQIKGNSQGYRLLFKNSDLEVPVARNFAKSLKDFINTNS